MESSRVRYLFGIALLGIAACASSTDDKGGESAAPAGFKIFPPHIYTGTDGVHEYKAPIITVNPPGAVTWTISDPTLATLAPEGAKGENLMLTAKKAGMATVTAASAGQTLTADIVIISYTPQQYALGEKRYTMSNDPNNPACKECHAPGKGPDHTSTELDADPDDEIQHTFVTGVDPENRPIAENSEYATLLKGKKHMWIVTDEEKIGLIAYLRALPPMGFPEYDAPTDVKAGN